MIDKNISTEELLDNLTVFVNAMHAWVLNANFMHNLEAIEEAVAVGNKLLIDYRKYLHHGFDVANAETKKRAWFPAKPVDKDYFITFKKVLFSLRKVVKAYKEANEFADKYLKG